jgi:hypothetical protein
MTVIQTCRLQNRGPWDYLVDAANAKKPSLSATFSPSVNILNRDRGVNGYQEMNAH